MSGWHVFARNVIAILVISVAITSRSTAQLAGAPDIIAGRVFGPDSLPLAGARVTVISSTTGATRNVLTGVDGQFTVLFRPPSTQYRLLVTFIGMRPAAVTLASHGDEDRLMVSIHLTTGAQELSPVEVRAEAEAPVQAAFRAGGNESVLPAALLEKLPVSPGDLFGAATLIPGAVTTAPSDTSRAAFSVAAQPSVQNNITLDGMTFLFGDVPRDALLANRLILNAYDVSHGQFTGAQLAATTKSGTSRFEASATFIAQPSVTQFAGVGRDAFAQTYSQALLSTRLGGPIGGAHRAFYSVSAEAQQRDAPTLSLSSASGATLAKLGVNPDSVGRLTTAVLTAAPYVFGTAPRDRRIANGSALARLDVDLNSQNQLMVRGDFRASNDEGARVTPLMLPTGGGSMTDVGGGGMVMLTSLIGNLVNEARAYSSWEHNDSDPDLRGPTGRIGILSQQNQRNEFAVLQFGGNPLLPRTSRSLLQEAVDEISYLAENGIHRVKLGILVNRERAEITGVQSRYGEYLYNSLADFDAGVPVSVRRTLAGTGRLIGTDNAALYISHAWQRTAALQLTYGVRLDASRLADAPEHNDLVAAAFRKQTRDFLAEFRILPRLGITYVLGDSLSAPRGAIRLGFGEFRGRVPSHLLQYVNTNAGFATTDSEFVCVGSAIPPADWARYFTDSSSLPRGCIGTSRLPIGNTTPVIAIWGGEGGGAPRVWRTALGIDRRLLGTHWLRVNALYAHGIHNPAASDLNLIPAPMFTAAIEQRPVYAHPAAFMPTGAVSLSASRQFPFFATAYEFGSGVSSRTGQLTAEFSNAIDLSASLPYFNAAYTFTRARDQSNGYPFSNSFATTAGDPRLKEWGTSDLERRHSVQLTTLIPLPSAMSLGIIGQALSGPRYTPMVEGDVNGDALRNDRAFVFPTYILAAGDDPAVAAAMQRLLASADRRTRDCLTSQTGRIASRNSCTTPWTSRLDLQLNWRPSAFRDRAEVSLMAMNVLGGIDRVLHGAAHPKGWGQESYRDGTLLYVTGFDSSSTTFRYVVNEHFGTATGSANPFRVPTQLGLRVSAQLGRR